METELSNIESVFRLGRYGRKIYQKIKLNYFISPESKELRKLILRIAIIVLPTLSKIFSNLSNKSFESYNETLPDS